MLKLWRHDYGTVIAIGLEGNDQIEIEHNYYSFWNHGATSGELHWLTDAFAYFWTTPSALWKGLVDTCLFELLNVDGGKSKGKIHGLMPEAKMKARERLNSIEYLAFLGYNPGESAVDYHYSLGVHEGDSIFTPPPQIE